uniref:Putative secreted protein n=1 Tax=Anopheles marajoara TaxID=58244 RepID=A0A2M4CCN6_9DIPT
MDSPGVVLFAFIPPAAATTTFRPNNPPSVLCGTFTKLLLCHAYHDPMRGSGLYTRAQGEPEEQKSDSQGPFSIRPLSAPP